MKKKKVWKIILGWIFLALAILCFAFPSLSAASYTDEIGLMDWSEDETGDGRLDLVSDWVTIGTAAQVDIIFPSAYSSSGMSYRIQFAAFVGAPFNDYIITNTFAGAFVSATYGVLSFPTPTGGTPNPQYYRLIFYSNTAHMGTTQQTAWTNYGIAASTTSFHTFFATYVNELTSDTEYWVGWDAGHEAGLEENDAYAYAEGVEDGEIAGYAVGYGDGFADADGGTMDAWQMLFTIIATPFRILEIEVLPGFYISYIVGFVVLMGFITLIFRFKGK